MNKYRRLCWCIRGQMSYGERIFLIAVSHLLWDLGRVSFTSAGLVLAMVPLWLCRARGFSKVREQCWFPYALQILCVLPR